jgi:hypothetical protein
MDTQEHPDGDRTDETQDISRSPTNTEKLGPKQPVGEAVEVTFPNKPAEIDPAGSPTNNTQRRRQHVKLGFLGVIGLLLLGLIGYGSYAYGYSQGSSHQASVNNASVAAASLQVPKGATIIEQCDAHKGTQYALPSDIPHGPVYNVYKGKVIGVEYMIGKQDLANDESFYNLPLFGQKYNHMNIGLLSEGHAGYPVPHYHVDIYTVSYAAEQAITCK